MVKNVAGYDITRLMVGSLGTLGILIEAAYRLHPLPNIQESVVCVFSDEERRREAARLLLHAPLEPTFFEAHGAFRSDVGGLGGGRGRSGALVRLWKRSGGRFAPSLSEWSR
ncbi:MAG: hypothetical protein KatS3mg115_2206 [Candidatus Poribacteria bacterium]|nr:MAG: hypothetical protein KatS3mg115_2206 [Candidatus Poribacteria bacterium]